MKKSDATANRRVLTYNGDRSDFKTMRLKILEDSKILVCILCTVSIPGDRPSALWAEGKNPYNGPVWPFPKMKKPIRGLFSPVWVLSMSRYRAGGLLHWSASVEQKNSERDEVNFKFSAQRMAFTV